MLLVHGYAEHSGRYEHMGAWLAARGCAVHAYDQQGHGRSHGARGHVRRMDDFLDDLDRCLAAAREEHPDLPTFVVGHSMGGLVTALWAGSRAGDVSGVVLSGPALRLGATPSAPQRAMLRLLRPLAPKLAMEQPIAPDALSRDASVGRAYMDDPLVFQRMTLSLAAEFFAAITRAQDAAAGVSVPVLLLHGGDDRLCLPEGSRMFFEALGTPGSDLRIYPGLRHEIFNEPEQEQVFADLLDWVRKTEARP